MITKRRFTLMESMAQAAEARLSGLQDLGFSPRDFVLCGLPYKRIKEHLYERRNGSFVFRIVADPSVGMPFGQDRLVPIWLATAFQAAGKPADNVIRFRSARDILRAFGIDQGGIELRTLQERIRRVFGATYFAFNERVTESWQAQGYRLIYGLDLWFSPRAQFNQHTLWQNAVQLTSEFADDLRKDSVPVDLNSVRALKTRPAALDLYVWQAWRSYRLAVGKSHPKVKEVRIPLFGRMGLLAQLGTTAARPRKARELFRRTHAAVQGIWPGCPNALDGDTFILRPGRAVHPRARLSLIGVSNPPSDLPPKPPPRVLPPGRQEGRIREPLNDRDN